MSDSGARPFSKLTAARSCIDAPQAEASVYSQCISVAGWLHVPERDPAGCRVRVWIRGELVGESNVLSLRPDVCAALGLPAGIPTGFRLIGSVGDPGEDRAAELAVTASWRGDRAEYKIARIPLQLAPARLEERPYGDVVHPGQRNVLHRENIYGSGPPVEQPGAEMLLLIQQYLDPGASVLDVGCGAGAYGPALRADGHAWLGLEVNPGCWEMLERRQLPFRKMDAADGRLPCADGEFDNAICIEVLEHIADFDRFLGEIVRAVKSRALFSVPNMEVLPYFSPWQVVPWHLLEADHKNFFTRCGLETLLRNHFTRVEVFSYADHPLRTPDGIALHGHLFAIAEK